MTNLNRCDLLIAARPGAVGLEFDGGRIWFNRYQIDAILIYVERVLDGNKHTDRRTVGAVELTNYAGYLQIDTPWELADLSKKELPKLVKLIKHACSAAFIQ